MGTFQRMVVQSLLITILVVTAPANATEQSSAGSGSHPSTPSPATSPRVQADGTPTQDSVQSGAQPSTGGAGSVTGKWKYGKQVDEMTDAEIFTLTVASEDGKSSLRLVCFPGKGGDRILHFLLALPEDPKNEYTLVTLRFDKKEPEMDLAHEVQQQMLLRSMGGIPGSSNYWLQTNDSKIIASATASGSADAITKDVIQANSRRLLGELKGASRVLYQLPLVAEVSGTEGAFDTRAFTEAFKRMAEKGCGGAAGRKQ